MCECVYEVYCFILILLLGIAIVYDIYVHEMLFLADSLTPAVSQVEAVYHAISGKGHAGSCVHSIKTFNQRSCHYN